MLHLPKLNKKNSIIYSFRDIMFYMYAFQSIFKYFIVKVINFYFLKDEIKKYRTV